MTDESRKLAEDNYGLFLYIFNKYKKKYTIIADSDFEEHIDIFYLCYCKQCYTYVKKHESKHKLSTYIDVAFRSICENALRHYNTTYMHNWRDISIIALDKMTDTEICIGDLIADKGANIAAQYETTEMLHNILEYVDNQIQTAEPSRHFTCNGWLILKNWFTNDFANTSQFLEYLRYEGLATDETTEEHTRKILSYYRKKLKGALERGEI